MQQHLTCYTVYISTLSLQHLHKKDDLSCLPTNTCLLFLIPIENSCSARSVKVQSEKQNERAAAKWINNERRFSPVMHRLLK